MIKRSEASSRHKLPKRVITWTVIWLVTLVGLRLTLLAAEVCPAVTVTSTHRSAVAAADWIVENQGLDGRYLYDWDLDIAGPTDAPYNLVRHAGTTMALYQFVLEGETSYLEAADTGIDWLLDRQVGNAEVTAIAPSPTSRAKLGTAALTTVGLVLRRQATGDTTHDELLRSMGRLMVGQQQPDGSMLNFWDPETEAPVPEVTSLFATGEALWALALLHNTWPDEGWDDPAWRTLDYMATDRDEDEDVWPRPWADQWAAYSLNEMAEWGLSDTHIEYAELLAAQWGIAVRWESQRNGGIDGLVHAPESIAAGQGTWLEGLGMMYELSLEDDRMSDLSNDLADRLTCGAGRMIDKQRVGTGLPEVDGGFFVKGVTRVDGQQHTLSGLIFTERVLIDSPEDP
ncbi:MAG: hypothetical protein ACR2PK_15900 [Acidimicrobiales bacterium]